jgi:uncharacterized membrane protein YtjA (UPF0391 family)
LFFGTPVARRNNSVFVTNKKIAAGLTCPANSHLEDRAMLYWAAVFFVVAIIAAIFGFGGIAAGATEIAKILFFVFLVLFVVSLLFGGLRRGPMV